MKNKTVWLGLKMTVIMLIGSVCLTAFDEIVWQLVALWIAMILVALIP